mgnify:CR=1 FL=1
MRPIPGGTYRVNDQMVEDMKNAVCGEHASIWECAGTCVGGRSGHTLLCCGPVAVDEFDANQDYRIRIWYIVAGCIL